MNTAIINKETEKAINVTFQISLYGESPIVKNVWFPKSCIEIEKIESNIISFNCKYDWFLTKKVKEYCQKIAEVYEVAGWVKTFTSPINNETIESCYTPVRFK